MERSRTEHGDTATEYVLAGALNDAVSISVFELEKVTLELIVMGSEDLKEQSKERLSSLRRGSG
jgi:hypothetical protein